MSDGAVTVPSAEAGATIARHLIQTHLAACVNVIDGVTSYYEWEGRLEEDSEKLLMIKTRTELVPELTEAVKRLHPADVCEVIVTELSSKLGAKDYLNWVRTQTGGSALEE